MPRTPLLRPFGFLAACWFAFGSFGCGSSSSGGGGGDGGGATACATAGCSSKPPTLATGSEQACVVDNGGVACWSDSARSVVIAPSSGVVSVSAGGEDFCAVTSAGKVLCWGLNQHGELGNDARKLPSPTPVEGLESNVQAIAVGHDHTCALTNAGAVLCLGANARGQLGNGTRTSSNSPVAVSGLDSGVVAIAAGTGASCAITHEGAVVCWGWSKPDQAVFGEPSDRLVPAAVPTLTSDAAAIAVGPDHACAIRHGEAWCWGDSSFGQIGTDDPRDLHQTKPILVPGLPEPVVAITTGANDSCAVTAGGAGWCWGDIVDNETPAAIAGLEAGVTEISAGDGGDDESTGMTCAVKDGAILCSEGDVRSSPFTPASE